MWVFNKLMKKTIFVPLKAVYPRQLQELMCVSTVIKTVLLNQKGLPHRQISIKRINKLAGYHRLYGTPIEGLMTNLNPLLSNFNARLITDVEQRVSNISHHLSKSRYPVLMVRTRELIKLAKYRIEVEARDPVDPDYHFIIVVGLNPEKQVMYYYDPLDTYTQEQDLNKIKTYRSINIQNLYMIWKPYRLLLYITRTKGKDAEISGNKDLTVILESIDSKHVTKKLTGRKK